MKMLTLSVEGKLDNNKLLHQLKSAVCIGSFTLTQENINDKFSKSKKCKKCLITITKALIKFEILKSLVILQFENLARKILKQAA